MSIRHRIPILPLQNGIFWLRFINRGRFRDRRFSTDSNDTKKMVEEGKGGMTRDEAYRQLENLDFMTATKILFTASPKRKKFGLDFHLVQLFFVCMPSLAVYLVAQYARSDMKKMDEELHLKRKKAEEEEKMKEEEKANKEKASDTELMKVRVRLDALEETVKELAIETKKISQGNLSKNLVSTEKDSITKINGSIKQSVALDEGGGKESIAAAKRSSNSYKVA